MDALSDVLRVARLIGGGFLHVEFFAPWCMAGVGPEHCVARSRASIAPCASGDGHKANVSGAGQHHCTRRGCRTIVSNDASIGLSVMQINCAMLEKTCGVW